MCGQTMLLFCSKSVRPLIMFFSAVHLYTMEHIFCVQLYLHPSCFPLNVNLHECSLYLLEKTASRQLIMENLLLDLGAKFLPDFLHDSPVTWQGKEESRWQLELIKKKNFCKSVSWFAWGFPDAGPKTKPSICLSSTQERVQRICVNRWTVSFTWLSKSVTLFIRKTQDNNQH